MLGSALRRWTAAAAAAALTAAALAACGSDGGGSDGGASDGETSDSGASDSGSSEEETFELRFSTFLADGAGPSQQAQWWADEVEKRTDGRVTMRFYFSGSLVPATENFPAIGDGRADVGPVSDPYHPAELALASISGVPFLGSDPEAQMRTFHELAASNTAFQRQYSDHGVTPLFYLPITPAVIATSSPINGLEDLEGVRIRAVGRIASAYSAAGANPVAMDISEVFEALERGTIDAISSIPFDVMVSLGVQDVASHLINPKAGLLASSAVGMNTTVWESMPEDIQEILVEVGEETMDRTITLTLEAESAACDVLLEAGTEMSVFDMDTVDEWRGVVGTDIVDEWRADAIAAGFSDAEVQEFYDDYVALMDELAGQGEYVDGVEACLAR